MKFIAKLKALQNRNKHTTLINDAVSAASLLSTTLTKFVDGSVRYPFSVVIMVVGRHAFLLVNVARTTIIFNTNRTNNGPTDIMIVYMLR